MLILITIVKHYNYNLNQTPYIIHSILNISYPLWRVIWVICERSHISEVHVHNATPRLLLTQAPTAWGKQPKSSIKNRLVRCQR